MRFGVGRDLKCFLDRDYNGNSWNDIPKLVAQSKTILVMLSENFVESPWCVLELLSAVVHQRPIAFFRVSDTFKLATFRKQLVAIGFPDVDALDKFSVEINYSEDHFDSAMNDIAERVESNRKEYPILVDVVTHDEVAQEYQKLRKIRNKNFPDIRAWPHWGGSDERNPTERSNKGMPKSKRTRRSKSKRR